MANFFDVVFNVLKEDERFFTADGQLLRSSVYDAAMKMDSKLIRILYENPETRARFFTFVDNVAIFDKIGFGWVINNREFLKDSYTRYKKKLVLSMEMITSFLPQMMYNLYSLTKIVFWREVKQKKIKKEAKYFIMSNLRLMK